MTTPATTSSIDLTTNLKKQPVTATIPVETTTSTRSDDFGIFDTILSKKRKLEDENESYAQKLKFQYGAEINISSILETKVRKIFTDDVEPKMLELFDKLEKELQWKPKDLELKHLYGKCPVCLDNMLPDAISTLKCGHVFCTNCLIPDADRKFHCGICRKVSVSKIKLYLP